MKNEIGIGIVDLYSKEFLNSCISSIPEEYKKNLWIVSNKIHSSENVTNYTKQVSMATMRNYLISQMRIKGLKYYFLLNSNVEIKNPLVFENTIKLANAFGTWFMTGAGSNNVTLEEDTLNISLNVSPQFNSNFIFLYSGIVKNFGYFDERFYNTLDLDIIDYINKLRDKKTYPPKHYNPTINAEDVFEKKENIQKINFKDLPKSKEDYKPDSDKSLELSVAYFYHKYNYLPSQNDPAGVTQNELLEAMEQLQKTYGDKQNDSSKL